MKARLEGTCKVCGIVIHKGEEISKTPDMIWVHDKCSGTRVYDENSKWYTTRVYDENY